VFLLRELDIVLGEPRVANT